MSIETVLQKMRNEEIIDVTPCHESLFEEDGIQVHLSSR